MKLHHYVLLAILLMVLIMPCAAKSPPAFITPGMKITYTAALSNYYSLYDTNPDKWEQFEGTGVYGYWVDFINSADGNVYSGQSTIYDHFSGNILVDYPWTYQPGDEGMGLFWIDTDKGFFTSQNLVAEGPLDYAGITWNAQTYYFSNLGSSFDTKITIDRDSGILLSKNEGLTGSNGQMQRAVYILKSFE